MSREPAPVTSTLPASAAPWHRHPVPATIADALAACPPTPEAARQRLEAVRPNAYARTRNHLDGAVTGLSPWITHGLLPLDHAVTRLRDRHALPLEHKLIQELAWRAYFRHAWRHRGDGIFASLHDGPMPDDAYAPSLPRDVITGATGVPVIDQSVRTLYATGTLHNHARMWLASYLVHVRKVHWRAGADWLWAHLLDGDLASNHLSWQWVAGTGSRKPYLFNAENVARHAPEAWHSAGTAIDTSYEALDRLAHGPQGRGPEPGGHPAVAMPPVHGVPPADAGFTAPDPARVAGRDVWLVHPWSLGDPPTGTIAVAVLDTGFHAHWPWSALRWHWVLARMTRIAHVHWYGPADAWIGALREARSVRGWADPHLGPTADDLGLAARPSAFAEQARHCASFSAWWTRLRGFADVPSAPATVPPPS